MDSGVLDEFGVILLEVFHDGVDEAGEEHSPSLGRELPAWIRNPVKLVQVLLKELHKISFDHFAIVVVHVLGCISGLGGKIEGKDVVLDFRLCDFPKRSD